MPWPEERVWAVQEALHEAVPGAGRSRRPASVCGRVSASDLAVEDVDFLRGVVHIRRQVKTVRYKHVFALPKYDKTRDIPLSEPVKLALAEHIRKFPPKEITLPWNVPGGEPQHGSS